MKTQDLFGSFFDPQDKRLAKLGDLLLRLAETVDWEQFRPLLERVKLSARNRRDAPETSCGLMGNSYTKYFMRELPL